MWLSGVKIHILTKKPMKHAHIKNRSVPNYLEHHAGTKLPLFNEENEHSNESEQQRGIPESVDFPYGVSHESYSNMRNQALTFILTNTP